MALEDELYPRPGPATGSQRPAGAPNFGSLGGRPPVGPGVSNSPMERLGAEMPPVPVAAMPPPRAAAPPPGAAVSAVAQGRGQGGLAPILPDVPGPPAAPVSPGQRAAGAPGQVAGQAAGQAPTPTPPPAAPTVVVQTGGQGQGAQAPAPPAPTPPATPPGPPLIPGTTSPAAPTAPITFQRLPFEDEMADIPDGAVVRTPWGEGRVRGGTMQEFRLSAAGKAAYGRSMVKARQAFGAHPWSNDPGAPAPPVRPGHPSFNPFGPPGKEWV